MNRVLVISVYFPPQASTGAIRASQLARHLPEFGFEPVVLTANLVGRSPDKSKRVFGADDSLRGLLAPLRWWRTRGAQPAAHTHVTVLPSASLLGRLRDRAMIPDSWTGWWYPAVRLGRRLVKQYHPTAIFSTSPPETVHLVARQLSRDTGLPWIADFRDGWTFEPPQPALRRLPLRRLLEARLERAVVNHASAMSTVSDRISGDFRLRYPDAAAKVETISNGYDSAEFVGLTRRRGADGVCRLVHTGSLALSRHGRSPDAFFRALATWRNRSGVPLQVQFVGDFTEEEQSAARSLGLSSVVAFVPPVARRQAHEYLMDADIAVLITEPGLPSALPIKLFDYIGAGAPILALAEGSAAADIVGKYDLGIITRPDDPRAIERALTTLIEKQRAGATWDGFATAQKHFEWTGLTEQLANLLGRVAGHTMSTARS